MGYNTAKLWFINKQLRVIDYGTNGDGIVSVENRGNDDNIFYIVAASANTSYVMKSNHSDYDNYIYFSTSGLVETEDSWLITIAKHFTFERDTSFTFETQNYKFDDNNYTYFRPRTLLS